MTRNRILICPVCGWRQEITGDLYDMYDYHMEHYQETHEFTCANGCGELIPEIMTVEWLRNHQNHVFVFGDNELHYGKGGAAIVRDEPNAYGFITKKKPTNDDAAFFKPDEYKSIYWRERAILGSLIHIRPDKTFIISKIGSGLANKYHIFEEVIEPNIKSLKMYNNVIFLW